MANNSRGFLSFKDDGSSRLTVKRSTGLVSADLGRITLARAHELAYEHSAVLIVNGRIRGRASIVPCPG